jgi:hypothetical protein
MFGEEKRLVESPLPCTRPVERDGAKHGRDIDGEKTRRLGERTPELRNQTASPSVLETQDGTSKKRRVVRTECNESLHPLNPELSKLLSFEAKGTCAERSSLTLRDPATNCSVSGAPRPNGIEEEIEHPLHHRRKRRNGSCTKRNRHFFTSVESQFAGSSR